MSYRIITIQEAIDLHAEQVGNPDHTTEQRVIDLLTSMRVYCDVSDLDFNAAVRASSIQHKYLEV